jgi:Holliday junction resolvase
MTAIMSAAKWGADRERKRIRRAQAKAIKLIRSPTSGMTRDYYADIIDAATRKRARKVSK